ncbi:MAG: hypothetical protein ACHQF2_05050 [Flavobacteriales bacterium]
MKKILIICLGVILLAPASLHAQKLYGGIGLGYGLRLAPNFVGADQTSSSLTSVSKSFGAGFSAGIMAGYFLNEGNLALQLDVNYLMGSKIEITQITPFVDDNYTYKSRMIRVAPSFKFTFGEKIKPYARFGVVFGFGAKLIEDYKWKDFFAGVDVNEITEYTSGLSVGFTSATGINFNLSDKISFFAEIAAIAQNWAPKNSIITKYVYGGVDVLSTMTTNQKETEYVDSYDPNTVIGSGSPDKELKFYMPFSSWGINLGVNIWF